MSAGSENGVGNMFVRHPGADEGVLPESLYLLWLQERQKAVVVLPEAENAFLIDSDREFRLFMCGNGDVPASKRPVSAISGNSLVGRLRFVLSNQKFRLFPLKLIGVLE